MVILTIAKIICLILALLCGFMALSDRMNNQSKLVLGLMSFIYLLLITKM